MTILIDLTQIPLSRTGVGVYADNLISNLIALLHPDNALILTIQSDDLTTRQVAQGHPNVRLFTIPAEVFRHRAILMAFEQLVLPFIALSNRVDVMHSLHYTYPLVAWTLRVVTIHDLTFLLFPQMHTRGRRWIMPFFIRRAMKHADAVIFVSKATQADAERMYPASRALRAAVPLGVAISPPHTIVNPSPRETLTTIGVTGPYILFIGTLEPRKNIVRIVRAFESIATDYPELTLVLAGKLGWHTEEIVAAVANSPAHSRIRLLGFVTEADKQALLRYCEMLVYPSLYEGFGLPVLEGLAAGAPVITSNISSMPEVAGRAALLVDPNSTDEIAAAMKELLQDKALASRLRDAGPAQAVLFTWQRTATSTMDVYNAVSTINTGPHSTST